MSPAAIANFMTAAVHSIGHDRTVDEAYELMRKHRIHHLPVLDGGKLVGLVSHRDLALVDGLENLDTSEIAVEDAMSADVFSVPEDAPVGEVAHRMANERFGSAIVQRGGQIVGIFTTTDALRALDFLLSSPGVLQALPAAMRPAPSSTTS